MRPAGHASGSAGLRVLHFMPTNFGMTGVETFILQLCAAQRRAGQAPEVAMDLTGRAEVGQVCAAMGTPVHDLAAHAGDTGEGAWLPWRKARSAMRRLGLGRALSTLAGQVNLLHVHSVGISGAEGYLAAWARGLPVVVTHHTTLAYEQHRTSRTLGFWLERRVADRLVMPYAGAAEEFVAGGAERARVRVIPFCVDEQRFTGVAAPPQPGALHLVFLARFCEGKGHDHLLEALARLRPRHPGLRATLVGAGPTRPEVEARIDRLGLRPAVALTGPVPHAEDIPALIRSAQVIVLPSHMVGETFPLSLLEGMAMGLPAIGTRWTGIPDIIADGETGLLVPPADVEALSAAIERFLTEPGLLASAGRKAAERVRAHFTAAAVAARYAALYQEIG